MDEGVKQETRRRKDAPRDKNKKLKLKQTQKRQLVLDKKQIIILFIGMFFLLFVILINNYTTFGLVLNKNIDNDDAVQVELQTTNNKIIPFGSQVLIYNKGIIEMYNSHGKNTEKIVLEDTIEADITTSGDYIQVINKDKGIVYVYKNQYEVARIKIEGSVYSGNINSLGTSVIEYSLNDNKTLLGIYDKNGTIKYNVKLSNNIIGKYVLSDNSKYLAYVDVNVKGISVSTNINLIDLSNIKEEENSINTIYSADNTLAYDIYWSGNNLIARFDENYVIYNVVTESKEEAEISKGQIVNVANYEKRCAYTLTDKVEGYTLCIRKILSEDAKEILVEEAPKYFAYNNGIVYMCYNKKIEAYNNLGMKIKTYNSDMVITEPVIFNNGRSLAMAISNKLIMFTI